MAQTLKEFLIKLGFKVNQTQATNFQRAVNQSSNTVANQARQMRRASVVLGQQTQVQQKQYTRLTAQQKQLLAQQKQQQKYWQGIGANIGLVAGATVTAAFAIGKSILSITDDYEKLYYQSKRIGTTVTSLKALQYGAAQIGVSADAATTALANMSRATRLNPGLNGLLNQLGIATKGRDKNDVFTDLIGKLKTMPDFQGAAVGQLFGIDPDTLQQLEQGFDQLKAAEAKRKAQAAQSGLSPDQLGRESKDFQNQWRDFQTQMETFKALMAHRFLPEATELVKQLNRLGTTIVDWDKATGGKSTKAIAGGTAITGALGATAIVKMLLGAGGGAAGGAAAAGGTGATAAAGIGLAPIVAGVIGALGLAWLLKSSGVADAAQKWGEAHPLFAAKTYTDPAKAAFSSGAAFTKKAEGFVGKVYADANKFAIGYGHQVKAGERFGMLSRPEADKLFQQDYGSAKSRVLGLTKGHQLNPGQIDALTDFEYNTGHLAGSTLLKKTLGGDYEGAAGEFGKWKYKTLPDGQKVVDPGLVQRRLGEESMFRGKTVKIDQKTTININGAGDAEAAGNKVVKQQKNVNGDLVRAAGMGSR